MGKPKKSDYVPDADLSRWFKLENYAGLANANPQKWAQLILDRANLRLWLEHPENKAAVRTQFERLETDPLCELGFGYKWHPNHALDTPSVKLVTVNRLRSLLAEIEAPTDEDAATTGMVTDVANQSGGPSLDNIAACAPSASRECVEPRNQNVSVDELLLPHLTVFSGSFAHLAVDLRATDEQLASDFRNWLGQWRQHAGNKVTGGDYSTKVLRWHQTRVLPYFDLRLYADIHGKRISRQKFVERLGFTDRPSPKDLLDQLSKTADCIISFDTYHALNGLSA